MRSDFGTVPWLNGRLTQTGNHHHAPCRRVPLSEVSTGHQLLGPHVTIGAIPIFDGGLDDAVALCLARVRAGLTTRVATANLDFFYVSRRDAQLRSDLQSAHLVVADGMPVTWLAKLAGATRTSRVAGVDFVLELCKIGGQTGGLRLAMYGSTEAIAHAAAAHIERMCPGVTITAVICPPFRQLDSAETAVVVSHLHEVGHRTWCSSPLAARDRSDSRQSLPSWFQARPGSASAGRSTFSRDTAHVRHERLSKRGLSGFSGSRRSRGGWRGDTCSAMHPNSSAF